MAILPTIDRQRIWRGIMRFWSSIPETVGLSKPDLLAAVEATDTWVDDNAAAFNAALPVAARNNLTASQKSLLLCAVVLMRFNIDLLKRVFGEVD